MPGNIDLKTFHEALCHCHAHPTRLGQACRLEERRAALRYSRAHSSMVADLEKADRARVQLSQVTAALTAIAAPAAEASGRELDGKGDVYGGDDFDDIGKGGIRYLEEL